MYSIITHVTYPDLRYVQYSVCSFLQIFNEISDFYDRPFKICPCKFPTFYVTCEFCHKKVDCLQF